MQRRTPLRSKAPPPRPARQWEGPAPAVTPPRATLQRHDGKARMVVPVPKAQPLRDENYRLWVASLPCINCGIEGYTQAAHGPTLGKGIKADDRTCVPLCADRLGVQGCHSRADQYAEFHREARAAKFAQWAEQVQSLYKGKNRA